MEAENVLEKKMVPYIFGISTLKLTIVAQKNPFWHENRTGAIFLILSTVLLVKLPYKMLFSISRV